MALNKWLCVSTCVLVFACAKVSQRTSASLEAIIPPILQADVGPVYPLHAREQGLQGSVGLYLLVTDSGQVKLVRISDSSGYDILDNAAIQYAKRLQFHPASRRGKPTSIWLTWRVDYKLQLREPRFVADKFFEELSRQMRLAEQTSGRKRDRILQKILDYQQKYVRILDEEAGRNFNGYVRKLVRAEVSEYWLNFWNEWPLRFVIFHDFVVRYPDSDLISFVEGRLLALMREDIERIKAEAGHNERVREKQHVFLKTIYTFLAAEYPQALTGDLKTEAEQYLQKN